MDTRQAKLAARVKAINTANKVANELHPQLLAVFSPLVGHKILKADGTLLAKIGALLPAMPDDYRKIRVHRDSKNYSLRWEVTVNEHWCETTVIYATANVYVGDLINGVLTMLSDARTYRTDYTVEEIQQKREAYKAAQKIADDAKSALAPFDEYDA